MTSVGDTLRREREKRKLHLEDVSRELKISHRMLEAIEADQYERLPGTIFAKAFVRQYANLLSLDGEELAGQVGRAMEPPELETGGQAAHRRPAVSPVDVPRVEEWSSVADRKFRPSGSLSAAAVMVMVMLICSAVYAWMQRPRGTPARNSAAVTARSEPAPQTPVQQAPPTSAQQPPTPQPAAEIPPAPTQAMPQQPATGDAGTSPPAEASNAAAPPSTAAPVPAAAPGAVHVEIVAEDQAWVSARADGKNVFAATLEAGNRRVVDANTGVELRLGNAGGVTILLNGKAVGPVGPKGQVRTVQLTSGGFQIVPPKPAAPDPLVDR